MRAAIVIVLLLELSVAAIVAAEPHVVDSDHSGGGCGTQMRYEQKLLAEGFDPQTAVPACLNDGPCDIPSTRDYFIPGPGATVNVVRLAIHVVANSDGNYPFATPEVIDAAVALVNTHYASSGIRFEYVLDQINSTEWRALSEEEIDPMKIATASDPTQWLNIWITNVLFGYSFGTMPYASDVLEPTGGIVMGQNHWSGNHSALAHEIGHCFGLMHSFYGVSEVAPCGPCYESMTAPDRDLLGDHCSDTPPAPVLYDCGDAAGTDSCSGVPWGSSQPENIMSYSPIDCRTLFTPQQQGRMRCWLNDVMSGWIVGQEPCCEGRVGDANGSGNDEPTISDVSVLIDAKFISGSCLGKLDCILEGDVNQSGGLDADCDDVTMGDISYLIDYLFITGPPLGLPDCF